LKQEKTPGQEENKMRTITCIACALLWLLIPPAHANDGTSVCKAGQTALLPNGARVPVGVRVTNNRRHVHLFDVHGQADEFEATFCGPWLDITNNVETTGRLKFVREVAKGVDNRLVAGRSETPYVTIRFRIDSGSTRDRTGRIVLKRPGIPGMGSHQAEFSYELRRNIRLQPLSPAETIDLANGPVERNVLLTGKGLDLILGPARNIPANTHVEGVRIVNRTPESIELAVRFRRRGDLTLGMLFTNFLQLAPGAELLPHPGAGTRLVRVLDANAPAHGQAAAPPRARIGVEGSATGNEGVGGGVRLPGRTSSATRTPSGGGATRTGAPDLGVDIANMFTSAGTELKRSEVNLFGLCAPGATDPGSAAVKPIPNLRVTVSNFGNGNSGHATLSFDPGTNTNFNGNLTFPVPALQPGESRTFEIERKETRVCFTHDCRRCGDGIHLGRFVPVILGEKGKVETKPANAPEQIFRWNDTGVTATISVVAGDNNAANNSVTVP
jgi:hypothetical protein